MICLYVEVRSSIGRPRQAPAPDPAARMLAQGHMLVDHPTEILYWAHAMWPNQADVLMERCSSPLCPSFNRSEGD